MMQTKITKHAKNEIKFTQKIIIEINNQSQICIPSVQFTVKKKIVQMKPNYFQVLNYS